MTVPGTSRPSLERERAVAWAEPVLGPRTAKRIHAFRDGGLYVKAAEWAEILAWLVDFVVVVLGVGVGFVVLAAVDLNVDLDNGPLAGALIAILFLVPPLYGALCFRDGRALGAVLTGTQVVRVADGSRIGGRAAWVMLVRTILMPLLFFVVVVGALTGGGTAPGGAAARTCVDVRATHRLRAAGITR